MPLYLVALVMMFIFASDYPLISDKFNLSLEGVIALINGFIQKYKTLRE
jgi:hypothetical protein